MDVGFFKINENNLFNGFKNINNGTFVYCIDTKRFYLKMDDQLVGISPSANEITRRRKHVGNCKNCGAPLKMTEKYCALVKCEYCGITWNPTEFDLCPWIISCSLVSSRFTYIVACFRIFF